MGHRIETTEHHCYHHCAHDSGRSKWCGIVFGLIVADIGVAFLLEALGVITIPWSIVWPVAVVALGVWMTIAVARAEKRRKNTDGEDVHR